MAFKLDVDRANSLVWDDWVIETDAINVFRAIQNPFIFSMDEPLAVLTLLMFFKQFKINPSSQWMTLLMFFLANSKSIYFSMDEPLAPKIRELCSCAHSYQVSHR